MRLSGFTNGAERVASLTSTHGIYGLVCLSSLVVGLSMLWLPPLTTTIVILLLILLLWVAFVTELPISLLIFSAYYALVTAGSRDFAHLGFEFSGVPIFVSELALFAVVVTLLPRLIVGDLALRKLFPPALLVYFSLGLVALLRGLPEYGLEAIRDSVLCYYAICYPITILLTSRPRHFRIFLYMMVASWAAASAVVLYRYAAGIGSLLHLHNLVRYGAGSQATSAASGAGVAVAAWVNPRRLQGRHLLYVLGVTQLMIGVFLIQHRSLFLAFIAVCSVVVLFCVDRQRRLVAITTTIVLLAMVSPLLMSIEIDQLPMPMHQTLERIKSIGSPRSDGSTEWRLFAWRQVLVEGLESPLFGVGFGRPFILPVEYLVEHDVDPHNSYLAIFYRLGLAGIAAFLAFWVPVLVAAYRSARKDPQRRFRIAFALSAHLAVAFFALFNVVLEGPYMGIPFWCTLGLLRQAIDTEGDWPVRNGAGGCSVRGA